VYDSRHDLSLQARSLLTITKGTRRLRTLVICSLEMGFPPLFQFLKCRLLFRCCEIRSQVGWILQRLSLVAASVGLQRGHQHRCLGRHFRQS
jgi:hypothetical protein